MTTVFIPADDDELCGCDVLFDEPLDSDRYDVDDEIAGLRALFPNGESDAGLADQWADIFATDAPWRSLHITDEGLVVQGFGRDIGIASRLRAMGLKVVEVQGWQTRGSASFNPRGSVDHHTAGPRSGNSPSLNICIHGRADLPGPLCNVFIARDNTCYVVAAGRANHAGSGGYKGLSGNSSVYGIERENVGTAAEPWRPDQTETAAKAHAALLKGRAGANMLCRHAEWTSRKPDTHSIKGDFLRGRTEAYLQSNTVEPTPPPPAPPAPPPAAGVAVVGNGFGGYYATDEEGNVWSFGGGAHYGSLTGFRLNKPIVDMVPYLNENNDVVGYWLIGGDGGTFNFGDAPYIKGLADMPLAAEIRAAAATPTQRGLWLFAKDRGIFALGDATFRGRP